VRVEHVIESTSANLELTDSEASALVATGQRLASDTAWFGQAASEERSVIRCTPLGGGRWAVRVQDAVGVIRVGNVQIVVQPKIPVPHLLHLFSKALQVPRLEDQPTEAEAASALWELVARWFVRATMGVLRRDLSRDYQSRQDVLRAVRGQVQNLPTARAYYTGRLELHCTFDDFVTDTPLNRLVKAAAREVSRSRLLTDAVRRDAQRIIARLEDVGALLPGDLVAPVERRTWYYRDAAVLARHILRAVGRSVAGGLASAWTFLIRTPELVETGLRQALIDGMPDVRIRKVSAPLAGTSMRVNPDLVFGDGRAVGDVKYKRTDAEWNRPDLYEVVAFAAAFRVSDAVLLYFSEVGIEPRGVGVGDIQVSSIAWNCSLTPDVAEGALCRAVREWATSRLPIAAQHA
jgi:5-methylcytosine-specific restriction enzyme subunit McrC